MKKILILMAHPTLERSRIQSVLINEIRDLPGVQIHDLYEAYPDLDINVEYEKCILNRADVIIFQHPFYWYSAPAILKQWMDLVLEYRWAYGPGGLALSGKWCLNAISTGGSHGAYREDGHNRFPIRTLLTPFDQTAHLCKMHYLAPFVIHSVNHLRSEDIKAKAREYRLVIQMLQIGDLDLELWKSADYINPIIEQLIQP